MLFLNNGGEGGNNKHSEGRMAVQAIEVLEGVEEVKMWVEV